MQMLACSFILHSLGNNIKKSLLSPDDISFFLSNISTPPLVESVDVKPVI